MLLEALGWLGIDWDEGPDVGGPYAPYRQSHRREIYTDIAARLLAAGEVYESFSTPEEIEARHRAADRDPRLGYDGFDRTLTGEQRDRLRAEGRNPVLRLRLPDTDLSWTDLVRGEITFQAGSVPDPVLVRADGNPLYTLTNPVDDALMRITHVVRGEDLMPSTPRQIALYEALQRIDVTDFVPEFGHLPLVTGEGNRKLSKRDPTSNLFGYRDRGFLPEGLLNYLALLGWAIAEDRDVFSVAELVEAFDVRRVSSNPARFDVKKAEAINAAHLRALPIGDFIDRILPHLAAAGLVADPPAPDQRRIVETAAPLVIERCVVLSDAVGMLGFLFTDEEAFAPDPGSAAKVLDAEAAPVLAAALDSLTELPRWHTEEIEQALKQSLVDGLGLKPRKAFAPVRVAITGRTVSPPLYESMELLGRDRSIKRLRKAAATIVT